MIARPTHWRVSSDGRESVAAPGEHTTLQGLVRRGDTSGKITSRPAYTSREIELIAFTLGATVAAVRQAIDAGLLETLDARDR